MSAPFTIDAESGTVRFPDLPLELRPQMSADKFIAASSRMNRDNLGTNDGWQRYQLRPALPQNQKLGMFLVFRHGQLCKFSFLWSPADASWDTWSEEAEEARSREFRDALAKHLGDKEAFPWGKAKVSYDSKAGETHILVDYDCSG
jgi:hypothetical protein